MIAVLVAVASLVLDLAAKQLALYRLADAPLSVIPGIFHLTLTFNRGAAFGLLSGQSALLAGVTLLLVAAAVLLYPRLTGGHRWLEGALGMILGGAVGNLVDRLRWGYVVDFLDFRVWPVFNLADSFVVVGTGIFMYAVLFRSVDHG